MPQHRTHRITGLVPAFALSMTALSMTALSITAPLMAQGAATPAGERILDRAIGAVQQGLEQSVNLWEDHSTWANAWKVVTPHFAVRTTSSYATATDIAQGLESMLGHVQAALATDFAPSQPLQVQILPDINAYNTFGNANGQEHSSFYGSFFAPGHPERPVAAVWNDNPTWLRIQITHSFVHQYLAAAYPGRAIPTWVDEGLAAYFSTFWDYGWSLAEYERRKAANELPPLQSTLRAGVDRYVADSHARFSQLSMLFYYLLRFREDTRTVTAEEGEARAPFRDYITALLEGRAVDSLPCHALLSDPAALERAMLEYEFPR